MKNYKYNELKAALAVCVICVFAIIVVSALVLVFPDLLGIVIYAVFGISIGVLLIASIAMLYFRVRKELRFFVSLMRNFDDIGFIRYDKKKDTATAHGKIEAITGAKPKSTHLKKKDYEKLLDNLYLREHEFEDNIFSSADGNNWYRLGSYESDDMAFTTIRDVTEYIEKISIINNLRFYDSLTGLLNKQAIIDMLKRKTEHGYKSLGIVHFAVNGIEKIVSFEGAEAADNIITDLALCVKGYDNSKSIFAGRTGNNGISVVLTQGDHEFDDYLEVIEKIHASITDTIDELSETTRQYVKVYCGYVIYRGLELDAAKMLAAAEFAAFDALKKNETKPVRYDTASYKESEGEFNKIRIFSEVISECLIDYHYQPIVSARTGDIYGYEALMRPREIEAVRLTPPEVLSIAAEQNMLERIESITLSMTLKILSDNQDIFQDRRLFVNSVSCVTLSENEYAGFVETYSELFPKLTIEITEANKLSDDIMNKLNTFFKPYRAHIALDDYGAGYSNDKTLLDVMPNYIKIDRSLITDINSDPKKKQLVANIISYAADHGVYSLAEGVETEEELETVIFLGIDLIQGYFTCRPVPIFMHEIDADIKNLIIKYSIMHAKRDEKIYEVKDDTPVDLVNLALFGYTDIVIRHSTVSFFGNGDTVLNMRIVCPDDSGVFMKFKDVNIHSDDKPVIEIGENSAFFLNVEGDNTMSNQGIRVPATSKFKLEGDGNLTINGSYEDGVCLGGNSMQSFGRIELDSTGQVNISNKCDKCVCIGGGAGGEDAVININSGNLMLSARGVDVLAIGAHDGDIPIMLNNCKIEADVSGINVVAIGAVNGSAEIGSNADITITGAGNNCCLIGSQHGKNAKIELFKGTVDINMSGIHIVGIGSEDAEINIGSNADISVKGSGDDCCLIGSLSGKDGKIHIDDGNVELTCNAKRIIGIGTISGECDVFLPAGTYNILCEGNNALCVGNHEGSGDIIFGNVIMKAVNNSSKRLSVATNNGRITISGGNIYTNSIDPIDAYSPGGSKLVCRKYEPFSETDKSMEQTITENGKDYRYTARPSLLFEGFYMYLPE